MNLTKLIPDIAHNTDSLIWRDWVQDGKILGVEVVCRTRDQSEDYVADRVDTQTTSRYFNAWVDKAARKGIKVIDQRFLALGSKNASVAVKSDWRATLYEIQHLAMRPTGDNRTVMAARLNEIADMVAQALKA